MLSEERLKELMLPETMVGAAFTNEAKITVNRECGQTASVNVDLQSGSEYGTYVPGDYANEVAWIQPGIMMPAPSGGRSTPTLN